MSDEQQIPELPVDLSHVDTRDLLNELMGRFDHSGFIGMKHMTGDTNQYRRTWKGNTHTVSGLCQDLALTAVVSMLESSSRSGLLDDFSEESEDDD